MHQYTRGDRAAAAQAGDPGDARRARRAARRRSGRCSGPARTGCSAAFYVFGLILGHPAHQPVLDAGQRHLRPAAGARASSASSAAAPASAARSAPASRRWTVDDVGVDNLLLVSAAVLAVCAGDRGLSRAAPAAAARGAPLADRRSAASARARRSGCSRVAAPAGHRAGDRLRRGRRGDHRPAAQHGGRGAQGASEDGPDGVPRPRSTFYLSLAGFVVQVGLTSRIHRSLGLAFALLLLPVGLGVDRAASSCSPARSGRPAVARVLDRRCATPRQDDARGAVPAAAAGPQVPRQGVRRRDDGPVREGARGNLLLLVLIKPWGLGLDWRAAELRQPGDDGDLDRDGAGRPARVPGVVPRSLGRATIAPDAVRIDVADPATIETLVEELANPDEAAVLYAIEMLETLDKRHLITPLLLHHESPQVRARALDGARRGADAHRRALGAGRRARC